jgi:hypothetical protein
MPAELQRIHSIALDAVEVKVISDEMRAVLEIMIPRGVYRGGAWAGLAGR